MILGFASTIIAVIALVITINLILNFKTNESNQTATLFTNMGSQVSEIDSGESVAELGVLRFGKFALFQLIDETSELELVSVNYDKKMEAISSARGRVGSGIVSAVNLLLGSELTLLDDRITVTNHGGSFTFEKKDQSTTIRIFSGSAKIRFLETDSDGIFEAVLIASEKVRIDDEMIADIFATKNETDRDKIWQKSVGNFEGSIEEEVQLASKLLEEIDPQKFNWFDSLREKLIFVSSSKSKLFEQEFLDKFSHSFNDSQELNNLLKKPEEREQVAAQKVLPFTRIFLSGGLSSSLKTKLKQLAATSTKLSKFAGIDDLSPATQLNRDLVFLLDDPTNISSLVAFLAKKENLSESDSETVALLFQLITKKSNLLATDWVVAWNIASEKIATTDPIAAVANQLALTQIFITDGRSALAAESLKKLVDIVSKNQSVFSNEALETIATEGNELKSRITFLMTLPGQVPFDKKIYNEWLFREQEKANADDGKVARPTSELSKFLDLAKNNDLENLLDKEKNNSIECPDLADNLENCAEYSCEFTHPFTSEKLERNIVGFEEKQCIFVEKMPGDGELRCEFDEATRKKVAEFYRVALGSDDLGASETENPLEEATINGTCIISGY